MRPYTVFISLLFLFLAPFAMAAETGDFPSLRESSDPQLQRALEKSLAGQGLSKAIADKRLSVALVDITNPKKPRVAAVNGDEMKYAASLPKIAILLGAFVEIEGGAMALDENTRRSLTQMVRKSSNQEATRMLNKVGKQRLLQILQSERFKLYDASNNGGIWVGKEYSKSPAYKRDPLHNLSHGATAIQTARFYYLLETGRLVNPELTAEMREMLSHPAINHKFVKGLKARPGAKVYRKSGSWSRWHADSAIVEDGGHKFIVVALAESPKGGEWLSKMITPLHDLIVPVKVAAANDSQVASVN
ncbi:MAG: serine hydrolase [Gammaproteobacteria bacterium]|jgi:beta-lactamase class A